MRKLEVAAPAKLNLSLDIVGRREDGYHLLRTVMQTVSLYDTVTLEEQEPPGISLVCPAVSGLPTEKNIAYRAAALFFRTVGMQGGLRITIEKRIPWGAGLGGGSADGASVLWGLHRMYCPEMPFETLRSLGLSIGADIPFCLTGGTALAEGIGEKLTPLVPFPDCFFVIAKPKSGIETAKAYAAFDALSSVSHPDTDGLLRAIGQGCVFKAADCFENVLQSVTPVPEYAIICRCAAETGGTVPVMTGSGSAFFSLYQDEAAAASCAERLLSSGLQAFVCRPTAQGPYET